MTITAAPAQAAGQQIYVGSAVDGYMECDVAYVHVTGTLPDATSVRVTNDGYQDRGWFEFFHYDGVTWVSDGYSPEMRNNDHLTSGQASWYDYQTGIWAPNYSRRYAWGTWVAVKVWILSGRDSNWYWTWAVSRTTIPQTTACQVLGLFCTAYGCYATPNPPGTVVVGGGRQPGA